jgi:Flp pilus assembly protein TadB
MRPMSVEALIIMHPIRNRAMDDLSPSSDGRTRPFNWIIGLVVVPGLVVLIILVLGSIVDAGVISFVIMGLIAVCISVFTYTIEVTRQEEEGEQARSVTTRANYRARATEALKTELMIPPENHNRTTEKRSREIVGG